MIDPNKEELITLCQAARLIPSARNGKKTAVSTLFRWASKGVKGIRLETLQVGGAQRTSKQALTRFDTSTGTLVENCWRLYYG